MRPALSEPLQRAAFSEASERAAFLEVGEGGQACGLGVMSSRLRPPTGDIFEGDFLAGRRHGPGKLTTAAGATFEGSWNEDTLDGVSQHSGAPAR